ncbi:MAG TPA: MMPL family transporter [Thermomicrobiales bacterium]|jgi:RND superfamily putative drug exporter|nr:MMPL family transporter [Thermomicrobiales bacterium]
MARGLFNLAKWCMSHGRAVVGTWLAVFLVAAVVAVSGLEFSEGAFSIPGTESGEALTVMETAFPQTDTPEDQIDLQLVFQSTSGAVTDASTSAAITSAVQAVGQIEHVTSVSDPFDAARPYVSENGQVAVADIAVNGIEGGTDESETLSEQIDQTVESARAAGLTVELGGSLEGQPSAGGSASEAVGPIIAFVVLVLTFGSFVAAGANMLVALSGVAVGILGVLAFSAAMPIQASTPILAVMLGLAVGIDYSLFIISRFRDELRAGRSIQEAVPMALGTAGSAVVFAGLTVVIALIGLFVVNIPFLTEMGVAAAFAIAIAVLASLTLLPILLRRMGYRALPKKERREAQHRYAFNGNGNQEVFAGTDRPAPRPSFLTRWAKLVTARPLHSLVVAIVAVAIVAIPVLSMDTALTTPGGSDPDSSERRAYTLIADNFGDGYESPLVVLVQGQDVTTLATTVTDRIAGLDNVASVAPAQPNPANTAAIISVTSTGGPNDDATAELVHAIRSATNDVTGADVAVTGTTAVDIDINEKLNQALIQYIILIVGLAMVLLVLLFRSILVPVIAALGFLLSLGASFGATVAVFQFGWGIEIFGGKEGGPLLSFLPVIIVGILFGLAMDYQVFLVSRIHEAHVRGLSTRDAIISGFRRAGAVVVAAALIMAAVFAGFGTSGEAIVGSIAVALTVGVLVDAFVVRMIIVPAAMTLLGARSWWIPRWLDRALPTIDTEGRTLEEPTNVEVVPGRLHPIAGQAG